MTQPASVKVLTDLLARLKAATGPDRELDCYIEAYVSRFKPNGRFQIVGPPTYEPHRFFYCPDSEMDWIGYDLLIVAPAYTASLDAALALVDRTLPGWCCSAVSLKPYPSEAYVWERGAIGNIQGVGKTLALALLAALLAALIKALIARDGGHEPSTKGGA